MVFAHLLVFIEEEGTFEEGIIKGPSKYFKLFEFLFNRKIKSFFLFSYLFHLTNHSSATEIEIRFKKQ